MSIRVVNYGGGVNSTALLCEVVRRKLTVDVIVFADTGSERPQTYAYIDVMQAYLAAHGYPPLSIVRWIRVVGEEAGTFVPLHTWCERGKTVPSRAYGYSGCTDKWKQKPADKFVREHPKVVAAHAHGELVERWIGYDADEPKRAERMAEKNPGATLWTWHAPLIEWGMGRDECLASIEAAGLPSPGKSACWMCPSSTKADIRDLAASHPELLKRSLDMEAAAIAAGNLAAPGAVRRGLGGSLNWGDYVRTGLGVDPADLPCGCYDGAD